MGCCYSFFCKDDGSPQAGEPNERTHLLVDPVSNNTNMLRVNSNFSEDMLSSNSNVLPQKTDEQTALNRILQETATNVIDVAALESHNLQQNEYIDRMKIYNVKGQQIMANNRARLTQKLKNSILQDIPQCDKVLASPPLSLDDINLINSSVAAASLAISELKVEHKEDLVVPFGLSC